jgi:molecular chaperone GrpE
VTHDPRPPAASAEAAEAAEVTAEQGGPPAGDAPAGGVDAPTGDADALTGDADAPAGDADAPAGAAVTATGVPGDDEQVAADRLPLQDPSDEGTHSELLATILADPRSRAELVADLLEAEAKRDEYLDDLRRSHAELENYRKRVLRDAALQRDHGRVDVVSALLESLDDLDRTEQAGAGSDDEALAKGVGLVSAKLREALRSIGVERIDAVGVAFDPTVHEAVQQVPAGEPQDEPQVVQVLRPGYRLGDRTLRAAMVVVSQ